MTVSYLPDLYQHAPDDSYLAVWTKKSKKAEFFSKAQLEAAQQRMLDLAPSRDVFHGWSLLRRPLKSGRGTADDVCASIGIMFDADLYSEDPAVHKQTELPRSVDEVFDWLTEAGIDRPSQVRSSGNGLYLDWLHAKPVVFHTDAERQGYASQVRAFHRILRGSAFRRRGWIFDVTDDLARVTRMPGTFNHKTNPAKRVEIIDV
jgi:hypothetical protein